MQEFLSFLHQKKEVVAIWKFIVREEQQLSTLSQNQTKTTTEPKQSSSDDYNAGIISMNERTNYSNVFYSILSYLQHKLSV